MPESGVPGPRAATNVPQVVLLGCGFGGLEAAKCLRRARVQLTVVDRCNHHLFQPLLYQVAAAGLAAPSIAAPIRAVLREQPNTTVLMAEVRGIDVAARTVVLDDGQSLHYDWLIVATGSTHSYFGHDEWAQYAPGLKTLEDALELRNRMLVAFEHAERATLSAERSAWLSFTVIGAGATGVEMAGTLAELARQTLAKDFRRIDPREASVVLVEAGERVLAAFPPDLSAKAQRQLERIGVEVLASTRVVDVDANGVRVQGIAGDRHIDSRTVIWAAGVAASPLGAMLGAPLDRAGRVLVTADLTLPGHPEVFVIGDLAHVENDGRLVPGVSPAAKQMGRHAARQILRAVGGHALQPFRYRDYGTLATIGRKAAVAVIAGVKLWGLPAWLTWVFAHLYFLIGFRNRLVVMLDWAWAYFSFQRYARIVIRGLANDGAAKDSPHR